MYHPTGYKTSERTTAGLEASLEASVQLQLMTMYAQLEDYAQADYHQSLHEVYLFAAHAWLYPHYKLPDTKKAHNAPDDL